MGFNRPKGFGAKKAVEQRNTTRYPVEAEVYIVSGPFSTKTKSVDISANGLAIKDPLPAELRDHILEVTVIYTSSSHQKIQASGKGKLAAKTLSRIVITEPTGALQILLDGIWA
jgi:hypothetical protein